MNQTLLNTILWVFATGFLIKVVNYFIRDTWREVTRRQENRIQRLEQEIEELKKENTNLQVRFLDFKRFTFEQLIK